MASLFRTISTYATLARKVYQNNKTETNAVCDEFKIPLTKRKRIAFYTAQSAITNHWFCTLRGEPANKTEQRKALLIGAITPLLDDAVDEGNMHSSQIINALESGKNSDLAIATKMYAELLQGANEPIAEAFLTALQAQDASLKQLHKEKLPVPELEQITAKKGGSWTFLYRTVLSHKIVVGEKEAIYALGYLMQLTNDAFDVYKDLQNHQQTLFTNTSDILKLKVSYLDQVEKIKNLFWGLPYGVKHKKDALLAISAIAARGLICIDQWLACQKSSGGVFRPNTYARKQLICDMEKPGNIWKSVQLSKHLFS